MINKTSNGPICFLQVGLFCISPKFYYQIIVYLSGIRQVDKKATSWQCDCVWFNRGAGDGLYIVQFKFAKK
jgi:hypothetical protein